ncbi:MAG: MBL fold metallo-hydrolase [Chloroflexota bacterium]|nr:MBL fold metallo-hydrolase [Chloroflexota bacterium]
MQQVSKNVYVETGFRGCNPGFVTTSEGIVMIDSPQNPSDAVKWREQMTGKGEVRYLFNTEPHGDHVTGNFFFPGTVIAQEGTREALSTFDLDMVKERMKVTDPEGLRLMEGYSLKKPSVTFSERLVLHLGEHTFEAIHLPGHTASETAVFIPEERVVFTGDNVFYKVQLFIHQGYPGEWLESLKRIGELEVDVIVPGHGEVCDKSYLEEQASFVRDWVQAVQEAIDKGLSKEEAKERISLLDRYPMGAGLEAMGPDLQKMNVERLYDLLSSK